jgi:hypothetical protein
MSQDSQPIELNRLQYALLLAIWAGWSILFVAQGSNIFVAMFTAILATGFAPLFAIIWCGWAAGIWFALLFVLSFLIPLKLEGGGRSFRSLLMAIFIGVTPHTFFVIYVNFFMGDGIQSQIPQLTGVASSYEQFAYGLQDRFGDYLLPTFLVGTGVSLLMFLFTARPGAARLKTYWEVLRDGARFLGLIILAASSFTVISGTASGAWEPNARITLSHRIAERAKSEARLALYQAALTDVQSANGQLRGSLAHAYQSSALQPHLGLRSYSRNSESAQEELAKEVAKSVRQRTLAEYKPLEDSVAEDPTLPRDSARKVALVIHIVTTSIDNNVDEARLEFAKIIGSKGADIVEAFSNKLVGALIEDAVTGLARSILETKSAKDIVAWAASTTSGMTDSVKLHVRALAEGTWAPLTLSLLDSKLPDRLREQIEIQARVEEKARTVEFERGRVGIRGR